MEARSFSRSARVWAGVWLWAKELNAVIRANTKRNTGLSMCAMKVMMKVTI
jgi:hypothetical protein